VTDLEVRRMRHRADAKALLGAALDALREAGADAYTSVFDSNVHLQQLPEVRVLVAVTVGDPVTEYTGTEVVVFAPDPAITTELSQRRTMAIATVKAVDPQCFEDVNFGLQMADMIATLRTRADAGDEQAEEVLDQLASALHLADAGQHDVDSSCTTAPVEAGATSQEQ
jgi:hypothetical protein